MELITPTVELKSSFLTFYHDLVKNDIKNSEFYSESATDFEKYVTSLVDESAGINLPKGYVPCDHLWFIDHDKNVLGVIRIRHNIDNEFLSLEAGHIGYDVAPTHRNKGYAKAMLKQALSKAKSLGIDQALITADENNIASRKVIESNGGVFDKIVVGKVSTYPIARYWVTCA